MRGTRADELVLMIDGGSLPPSYGEAQDRIFHEAGCSWRTERFLSVSDALGRPDWIGAVCTSPFSVELDERADIRAASAQLAGGVDLLLNRGGKRLGYFVGALGALLALERRIGSLRGEEVVVCGTGPEALAFVQAFAEAGARSVTLLSEDKEQSRLAMEGFLERFGRLSLATILLPAANEGHRSFREAFEQTSFRFGSYASSMTASHAATLICRTDGAENFQFRPASAEGSASCASQRVLLTAPGEDAFTSAARAARCEIFGSELLTCGRAALSQQTLLSFFGQDDGTDFGVLYDVMASALTPHPGDAGSQSR